MITIIHKYVYGGNDGIADFIRGSLNLYSFCIKRNYSYYIDFEDSIFNICFDVNQGTIPKTQKIIYIQLNQLNFESILEKGEYIEDTLDDTIKKNTSNEDEVFEVTCNCINITKDLFVDSFKEFFKPSKLILNYIKTLNLPNDYVAVHLRYSDKFINDTKYEGNPEEFKETILKIFPNEKNIIFFSNNSLLKKNLNKYFIIHDIEIIHTNNLGYLNNNSVELYIKTIAEFYMISFSKKVLSLNMYSGFSHISSYLEGKEYIVTYKNKHLKFLNNYISFQNS